MITPVDLHVHPLGDYYQPLRCNDAVKKQAELKTEQIVRATFKLGYRAIAITDHGLVDSIPFALEYGQKYGVEIIPGVELGMPIVGHVLCYFIDYERFQRDIKSGEFLSKYKEADRSFFDDPVLRGVDPREHGLSSSGLFAKIMEIVRPVEHFKRFVDIYQEYGGVVVNAHAFCYERNRPEYVPLYAIPLIDILLEAGVVGFEVYTPHHTQDQITELEAVLQGKPCIVTGGSDAHSHASVGYIHPEDNKDKRFKIPYRVVRELKQAKKKLDAAG